MTSRRPVPALITLALDAIGAQGPEVDIACGGREPDVDEWEAGLKAPTDEQMRLLAAYTGMSVEFFYRDDLLVPGRVFACQRHGKGRGLTIIDSRVDAAGVLHSTANGKRLHPAIDPAKLGQPALF